MKAAATIGKQLFHLAKGETCRAAVIVAFHMGTTAWILIWHRWRRVHGCAGFTLLCAIGRNATESAHLFR